MKELGAKGFSKDYWDVNYEDADDMDGIGNAKEHVGYIKYLFGMEYIDISSIIDLGFGLGHLFEALLDEFKPYKAHGIEPSEHAYNIVKKRDINKIPSTKFKLEKTDLVSWCERNKDKKKSFDLAVCTSVFQYLTDEELEYCLPILANRAKYLYLTVPTDKELDRQIEDLEFKDEYAIRRSRTKYQKMLKPHFTFISSRLLESKVYFDETNTNFTDLLYRF
ncbi:MULTISPECIES: class I SAM-dependent methyltransferase [Halobacteriovorax]|uniref:Class I SAM-dependent methyltransferase n=1 Tax=Halobacteriovorax vibrionivorans TaxID=2152716 RepID=A0ABY0IDT4_9BACT|nr:MULTISPECIES: class I SAM-dependent methyltransferase [Halobacteriovorax]RZF21126.1 class I SAM-dependent methyltransferase [Halobacteriovorax vibrionivorans]TGD46277.1 class I SAM-dependent methyltransferase [Halobacteriovorax sp. Y22]